jgi:hypothetical protein
MPHPPPPRGGDIWKRQNLQRGYNKKKTNKEGIIPEK